MSKALAIASLATLTLMIGMSVVVAVQILAAYTN
jgi:hypothetical protein